MLPDVTETLYPVWLEKVEAELKKSYMFDTCHAVLNALSFPKSYKYLITTQKSIKFVLEETNTMH
jgi:hypothetical protein